MIWKLGSSQKVWNTGNKWEIRENNSDHIIPCWGIEWYWTYQTIPSSKEWHHSSCSCPATQPCATLCGPVGGSAPGFPVLHHLPRFAQTHVHWGDDGFNSFIFCHPLLFLTSIFPSIRVFSNESALQIRWSKYWRFSFNICPCNEHSGYYLSKGLFLLWKEKNFLVVISVLWKLTYKVGFTLHTHTPHTHTYACMHTHTYTHTGYLTIALHIPKVKQEGKI